MFTGIIQAQTPILSMLSTEHGLRVRVKKPKAWKLKRGESIAIDGICSTVTDFGSTFFSVLYMPETLSKTTAAAFRVKQRLNLERSLRLGDALDGHIVQGHVDTRSRIVGIKKEDSKCELTCELPRILRPSVALHGSIAINGVSLTVARKTVKSFTVAFIPYTLDHTNLGLLKVGDHVNLEVDLLARYVRVALEARGN